MFSWRNGEAFLMSTQNIYIRGEIRKMLTWYPLLCRPMIWIICNMVGKTTWVMINLYQLWTNSADDKLIPFLSFWENRVWYFLQIVYTRFDIFCKLSQLEPISMKFKSCFLRNIEKYFDMSAGNFTQHAELYIVTFQIAWQWETQNLWHYNLIMNF